VVGCGAYFALLFFNKAKTQFKDYTAFEVKEVYEDVLKDHIA
jgi:hypothetical protein